MDTERVGGKRKSVFVAENGPSAKKHTDDRKSTSEKGYITKMTFPNFDRNTIYSVDVHPDGSRFAAGGAGDDNTGRVAVWQIVSLKEDRPELCLSSQMDDHSVCVNCVRWSRKGHYLASGANDHLVMIWHPVISNGQENWRRAHVLRSHSGDVFSVAWSPTDSLLASCSVDNTIVIWNAEKAFQIKEVLRDCQSLVKGVAWDPIGKFLAAQDDQSLRVWRTADWKQEHVITEQFDKNDSCAQVLRLDWSTDGANVISAHASNEGRPVAQIIERNNNWKNPLCLVGHAKPVICVRFNPRMFISDPQEVTPYCVFATGGRDHNVIVWNFRDKRPHAFLGLFKSPVMDISWFPNGLALLACSLDGSIAYVHCGPEIVGKAISKEQQNQALTKLYGRIGTESAVSSKSGHDIIEYSAFLDAQSVSDNKSDADKNSGASADNVVRLPYEGIPLDKQRETMLANGRRRITPVFIPDTAVRTGILNPIFTPFANGNGEASQSSSQGPTTNGEETSVVPTVNMARPLAPMPLIRVVPPKPVKPDANEKPQQPKKIKDKAVEATTAKDVEAKQPPKKKRHTIAIPNGDREITESRAPPKQTSDAPSKKKESKLSSVMDKKAAGRPSKKSTTNEEQVKAAPAAEPVVERASRVVSVKSFEILAPLVSPSLQISVPSDVLDLDDLALTAENDLLTAFSNVSTHSRLHKLLLLSAQDVVWMQCLTSPSTVLAASSVITSTASENCSLTIWCTESGAKLHEVFLGFPICFLACSLDSVLVITSNGSIGLWIRPHRFEPWTHVALGSVEGMLKVGAKDCAISNVSFTETDVPVIATSDHRHFICDVPTAAWMVVHDENVRFGNYVLSTTGVQVPNFARDSIRGPLAKLQSSRSTISVGSHVTPEVARLIALGFLEKQIQLARVLKSPTEYEGWMGSYALSLVDFDCIPRLRVLLDSLMGPPGTLEDITGTGWEPEVLGMSKRAMLEKLLKVLSRRTAIQRILVEYKQRLDAFSRNIFALQR